MNGRTFTSLEHLNEMTMHWLAETADVRVHRETKRRPIDLFEEEKPHLLALPAHAYDTARVLYRTVDPEGHIAYLQNFYSVPWQRIGELLPVRVTENELIVYGPDVKEIARHELYPAGTIGQRRTLPAHSPGRDHHQKREMLAQRFAEFGPEGVRFFEELLRARRNGKDEAARVLGLLTVYRREDLVRALERAVPLSRFLLVRGGAHSGGAGQTALGDGSADDRRTGTVGRDSAADVRWPRGPRPSTRRCWRKRRKTRKAMKAKTTDQTTPLRDRCLSHFATLRIPVAARSPGRTTHAGRERTSIRT